MTFRDLVFISTGNLWRMKLRTFLTISGVVIAIAAFVSMLSFGAGNQRYITKQFNDLGLFTTMHVYPQKKSDSDNGQKTKSETILDNAAIEKIARLPGVNLVYPYDAFTVQVKLDSITLSSRAQSLPQAAVQTKLFSKITAGKYFVGDSSNQMLVTDSLMKLLKFNSPDSIVGKKLVISVKVSSIDSGLAHVLATEKKDLPKRLKEIDIDSLLEREYRMRFVRGEISKAAGLFVDGFLNAREEISETLTVCGVFDAGRSGRFRIEPMIIPMVTARHLTAGGMGSDPADIIAALASGNLFGTTGDFSGKNYSQVTLDLDPHASHKTIRDSVEALGYRAFSYAEQFDEIRRAFFYFDLALGIIGLIALITASLGIVNTMVMSISERRREIGVLKSLGGDDADIRLLFLAESGVIGAVGAIVGIITGWLITRLASFIAVSFMRKEGIPPVDLFALPIWLILIALGIGVIVSLLAGYYPASRASRVDPVDALRNE